MFSIRRASPVFHFRHFQALSLNLIDGRYQCLSIVVIDKYETLCRGIGRDLIEDHVRAIREHEAYEKQQRKMAHMM